MKPSQNNNIKKKINRIEIIEEDRTRYFGDKSTVQKSDRVEIKAFDDEQKKVMQPLILNKKNINETVQEENNRTSIPIGKILGVILILALISGSVYGVYYYRSKIKSFMSGLAESFSKRPDASSKNNSDLITGNVSGEEIEYVSELDGKVIELNISKGIPVKSGELLIVIENDIYRKNLESAEEELQRVLQKNAYTQVDTNEVKSVPVTTKKTVNTNRKEYSREILAAEEKFRNDREAYNAGLISRVEYEQSIAQINRAREKEKAAASKTSVVTETKVVNTTVTNKKVIPLEREKVLEIPEVKEAIENYKKAYTDFINTRVYAQFSGIIKEKYVEQDQEIIKGQKLFKIVSSNKLFVNAEIDEKKLTKTKQGSIVKITSRVDQKEYEGIVESIKPSDKNGINIVQIIVDTRTLDKNNLIPIGSTVDIKLSKNVAKEEVINEIQKQKTDTKTVFNKVNDKEIEDKVQEVIGKILKN